MEDYKVRVIEELVDLSVKLHRLEKFTKTDVFKTLPLAEISSLNRQLTTMRDYRDILRERIKSF